MKPRYEKFRRETNSCYENEVGILQVIINMLESIEKKLQYSEIGTKTNIRNVAFFQSHATLLIRIL